MPKPKSKSNITVLPGVRFQSHLEEYSLEPVRSHGSDRDVSDLEAEDDSQVHGTSTGIATDIGTSSSTITNLKQQPQPQLDTEASTLMTKIQENSKFTSYPEGGLKAWTVVFGSWCAMSATFGITNALGYLQAWLGDNQLKHKSQSDISWIFSIYLFLFFLGGVQVGPVFDTYGLKFVLWPGCIGVVVSFFLTSICTEYYQFLLAFGVLGGFSASLVFTPSIAVIGHWFFRRRGLATGIAATGGATGGIIFPLVMINLMPKLGFGWAFRVIAFIILVLVICALMTLETRIPPDTDNSTTGQAEESKKRRRIRTIDLKTLKDVNFIITCSATFLIELASFIPLTYISTYALHENITAPFAYQILAVVNATSVFGRALPGIFADKWGRFNVMVFTTAMSSVSCLAVWLPAGNSVATLVGFAVMFGFWSGAGICLTPVCISQICRTEDYGTRYGTTYFFVSFGVLIGIPIAGELLSVNDGNFDGLIIFTGVVYLCGSALFLAARIFNTGFKLKAIF